MAWEPNGGTALMTVIGTGGPPSLTEAAAQLGLDVSALDPEFGVVMVQPDRALYSVRVAAAMLGERAPDASGPYADPKIEPFR